MLREFAISLTYVVEKVIHVDYRPPRTTSRTRAVINRIVQSAITCATLGVSLTLLGYAPQSKSQNLISPQQATTRLDAAAHQSLILPAEVDVGDAAPPDTPNVYRSLGSKQILKPKSPGDYLRESPDAIGKPQLVIAHYNFTEGLLAAYQSVSGKRILLRAQWRANGTVDPEVAHRNSVTGEIELLMGRTKQLDPRTGKRAKVFEVAGMDFMSHLDNARRKKHSIDERTMKEFVEGDAGRAFAEAMPALYAALEPFEADSKLVELQAPFGGVLTALQLTTGAIAGFAHSEAILGKDRTNSLRDNCRGECQYRGRHFTVQNSGLFDVLGKSSEVLGKKSLERGSGPTPASRSLLQTLKDVRKNGDGVCTLPGGCFGGCGPGCFTPGDIYTPECYGHDMCVCKWGAAACVVTIPADCSDCNTLLEAIWSFLSELFRLLFEYDDSEEQPGTQWW